jgi:hypothetical protein
MPKQQLQGKIRADLSRRLSGKACEVSMSPWRAGVSEYVREPGDKLRLIECTYPGLRYRHFSISTR